MAFFALTSKITIGQFTFSGVHEVRVERSIYTWEDRAYIKIPSTARILKNGNATATNVTTGNQFTDGDPVTIQLGYNGALQTEFEGFVRRRNIGKVLEVECEGYARLLRNKTLKADVTAGIKVKKLLELICADTGITVDCNVDMTLYGRELANADGCKVLQEIVKASDGALLIYFISPKKLWCGLAYTQYMAGNEVFALPTVNYRLGRNCPDENGLRERIPDEPVQVYYNGMLASGDTVRTQSDEKTGKRKIKAELNGWRDVAVIKTFVTEKANRMNYTGYEGTLTAFLEPYCQPGYTAGVADARYPDKDGKYLVEGVKVVFGMQGARRMLDIGVKTGGK